MSGLKSLRTHKIYYDNVVRLFKNLGVDDNTVDLFKNNPHYNSYSSMRGVSDICCVEDSDIFLTKNCITPLPRNFYKNACPLDLESISAFHRIVKNYIQMKTIEAKENV